MDESSPRMYEGTTVRKTVGPVGVWIGKTILRVFGWKVIGEAPKVDVCVTVGEPHERNADLPFTLAAALSTRIPIVFMVKNELFWWPMSSLLRWLGGVPVNRKASATTVDQMADMLRHAERCYLVITPSGTRKPVPWKTGFYWIAHKAGVPIFLCYIHYEKKEVGYGPLIYPTGDFEADWEKINGWYREARGREFEYQPPRREVHFPAQEGTSPDKRV